MHEIPPVRTIDLQLGLEEMNTFCQNLPFHCTPDLSQAKFVSYIAALLVGIDEPYFYRYPTLPISAVRLRHHLLTLHPKSGCSDSTHLKSFLARVVPVGVQGPVRCSTLAFVQVN